jgi:hypothetical protein
MSFIVTFFDVFIPLLFYSLCSFCFYFHCSIHKVSTCAVVYPRANSSANSRARAYSAANSRFAYAAYYKANNSAYAAAIFLSSNSSYSCFSTIMPYAMASKSSSTTFKTKSGNNLVSVYPFDVATIQASLNADNQTSLLLAKERISSYAGPPPLSKSLQSPNDGYTLPVSSNSQQICLAYRPPLSLCD